MSLEGLDNIEGFEISGFASSIITADRSVDRPDLSDRLLI